MEKERCGNSYNVESQEGRHDGQTKGIRSKGRKE
jgi:hypothetical protein